MIETPFNYTGSKFKLLPQLLPEMDYSKEYFVDLFCGGGSVYTNIADKYEKIIVNDIIPELIQIHKELVEDDLIIEKMKKKVVNKDDVEGYSELRKSFNTSRNCDQLWALMLCCNSNMMRFNQKFEFNQTFGKRTFNNSTKNKIEIFTKHIRQYSDKIKFISKHFSEVKVNIPSMVYIDPSYSNSEAGYNAYWKKDDDIKLFNYCMDLNNNGSSFMVSGVLNHNGKRCELLELLLSNNFSYKELIFDYNKISKKGKKETIEIIITNY